ncbi:MAG: hypothetical protein J6X02_03470 [Bacilli bacterium]|nr:hypothetical protein [Bacilli bacterium]
MKKVLFSLILLLMFCGCKNNSVVNVIKSDYESLNDKYLKVTIPDNKIEKIDYYQFEEVKKNVGALYFCLPTSNYCRNNIEVFVELYNDLELNNIYYIDLSNKDDGYKNFIKEYNKDEDIKYGDVIIFGEGKIIDKLSLDKIVEPEEKLSEEEKKNEYKRLYDFLVQLNDPDICDRDSDGC